MAEKTVTLTMTQLSNALAAAHQRGLEQLPLLSLSYMEVVQQQDLFMETPLQNVIELEDATANRDITKAGKY